MVSTTVFETENIGSIPIGRLGKGRPPPSERSYMGWNPLGRLLLVKV